MPKYLVNSGLPSLPSGLTDSDAGLVTPLYLAVARLAQNTSILTGNVSYTEAEMSMVNQTTGLIAAQSQRLVFKALEPIGYGQLITITPSAGKIGAYKADHTIAGRTAHGVCNSPGGIDTNEFGEAIFMHGLAGSISGTTAGASYWLSTAGLVQSSAPASGIIQKVGVGMGVSGLYLMLTPQ